MCGILGGIGLDSKSFVPENLKSLTRRGPDNSDYITLDNGLSIGVTRLAMTDPHPRSNQPMMDLLTKNVIAFNGEIYNYKDLRKSLISRNIKFYTESDTEVLLHYLSVFGLDGISELEGMYAFAFYNHNDNTLTVGRDFLGKKPLYYTMANGFFLFASQASLLKNYCHDSSLDTNSLSEYLRIGYIQDPHTMFKNIYSLNPGEVFELNLRSLRITKRQIIVPNSLHKKNDSKLSQLLDDSILERVSGHPQFAISMSGGKDSSLIAMQAKKLGLNFRAYTMHYSDSDKARYNYDYLAAHEISKFLGIKFSAIDMPNSSEVPKLMDNFVMAMDEPNINPTGLAQMILFSKVANDGNKLILTGDGADEIFGGYSRYTKVAKLLPLLKFKNRLLEKLVVSGDLDNNLLNKLIYTTIPSKSIANWVYWHTVTSQERVKRLTGINLNLTLNQEAIRNLADKVSVNKVGCLMSMDLAIYISMESNRRLDRTSMWNSIEARSPFQSEKIIGFANEYMRNTKFSKLNKELFFDEFPDLRKLPLVSGKIGFVSPLGHWMRLNEKWTKDSLDFLGQLNFFNASELRLLYGQQFKNNWNDTRLLWSLVVFSNWYRASFNSP